MAARPTRPDMGAGCSSSSRSCFVSTAVKRIQLNVCTSCWVNSSSPGSFLAAASWMARATVMYRRLTSKCPQRCRMTSHPFSSSVCWRNRSSKRCATTSKKSRPSSSRNSSSVSLRPSMISARTSSAAPTTSSSLPFRVSKIALPKLSIIFMRSMSSVLLPSRRHIHCRQSVRTTGHPRERVVGLIVCFSCSMSASTGRSVLKCVAIARRLLLFSTAILAIRSSLSSKQLNVPSSRRGSSLIQRLFSGWVISHATLVCRFVNAYNHTNAS
mmetsp:Transcript_18988/g.54141  ORF Transcript_18988/g.54141 Transcript_18988/m.54141 type:complete len:270 (+) Transcript_18988:125-934(+)